MDEKDRNRTTGKRKASWEDVGESRSRKRKKTTWRKEKGCGKSGREKPSVWSPGSTLDMSTFSDKHHSLSPRQVFLFAKDKLFSRFNTEHFSFSRSENTDQKAVNML